MINAVSNVIDGHTALQTPMILGIVLARMSGLMTEVLTGLKNMWSKKCLPNFKKCLKNFRNNFVALNIYYKELTYSYFEQIQGSDLVVLFSKLVLNGFRGIQD